MMRRPIRAALGELINMPNFSSEDCAQWTSGVWRKSPQADITAISHDTRNICPGSLYVAIEGENHDGHIFVEDALAAGAVAALVRENHMLKRKDLPLLEVADTRRALIDLARNHRKTLKGTICSITGSVGKTTVKELLRSMLSRLGSTTATKGNWNNDIGLPLSILSMDFADAFGVFEVAMNRPGEIALLCDILKPHCGIMTTVGLAHSEYFDDVADIAIEKSSMLKSLPHGGFAVISNDEEFYELFKGCTDARIYEVSMSGEGDYRLQDDGGGRVVISSKSLEFRAKISLPGEYMRKNALLATAAALELGCAPDHIVSALASFRALPMRWERRSVGGVDFVVDAYNANPVSMKSSIQTFGEIAPAGRRWLVLGGMLELGEHSASAHRMVGDLAASVADRLILVGEETVNMRDGALRSGMDQALTYSCTDADEAADILSRETAPGDSVLLKASRLYGLDRIIEKYAKTPNLEETR